MKKVQTAETTPNQINWLVSKCEFGVKHLRIIGGAVFLKNCDDLIPCNFATDPGQAFPIIEREIDKYIRVPAVDGNWVYTAMTYSMSAGAGPTFLIAAMRCYIASKLGDEVEVPKELV